MIRIDTGRARGVYRTRYAACTPGRATHSSGATCTVTEVDLVIDNRVHDLIIDRGAVVGARVVIKVVLDVPTELKQVIAFHPGHVVAQHLVLAIPHALARALVVDVVRNQRRSLFGAAACGASAGPSRCDLQRAAQAGKLRRIVLRTPLPPVPQIAQPQVISDS